VEFARTLQFNFMAKLINVGIEEAKHMQAKDTGNIFS
jgi:hypothetical protein